MIHVGDRVKLQNSGNLMGAIMPESLIGKTGIVESTYEHVRIFVVKLDEDVPGFYSGKAWASEFELKKVN